MAHTITKRWAAIATVTAALLALTACGKSADNPGAGAGPGGSGELGGAASASADPSANPSSTDSGGGSGGSGGGGGGGGGSTATADPYPKDSKAYQQQFLLALSNGDLTRVADLGNADQLLFATNTINMDGKPNSQWSASNCSGNNCQWHNAYGDLASVATDNNKLGQPHAISYFSIDRTSYASDPGTYVYNFLAAAQAGNKERMVRLSSATVADRMTGATQLDGAIDVKDLGGGLSQVDRHPVNATTPWYSFKVLSQPGGKAGAIKSACAGYGCAL